MNKDIAIKAYVALLKVDPTIDDNFWQFGPNHPKIGDVVSPSTYFSYKFTYKIDRVPQGCKLTREQIQSTTWVCTKIHHQNYNVIKGFTSVDKIDGRRRTINFKNYWDLKFEIVDMPEKARLIIDYKSGKFDLLELVRKFKEKKYNCFFTIKSIGADIDGEDYLEAMTIINNEKEE